MDVAVLRGRIVATLDADADARRRAELDLKTVSIPVRPSGQSADGVFPRLRTIPASPTHSLISCKLSMRLPFDCRVCRPQTFYPAAGQILTHHCSGCLPQESRYKRVVSQRGLPTEQTDIRRREIEISRSVTTCPGFLPTPDSTAARTGSPKDSSLRFSRKMALLHKHYSPAAQYQRCLVDFCWSTVPPRHMSRFSV
jgi:hypothetical protein